MMRLWRLADRREVLQMATWYAAWDRPEWVALTPDGYYVASDKGDGVLRVRSGDTVGLIDEWRVSLQVSEERVENALR